MADKDSLLIKQEKFLESGIHIGTKMKVRDMTPFIYRTRSDGLFVLDLRKINDRLRIAGKHIARYNPEDIVVVASRTYSSYAAAKFCELTGSKLIHGRFVPGIFTNVARPNFMEPKLIFICDPKGERQAVVEAGKMGITTVGLCDTDNFTSNMDLVIPCNNKGRKSLALIFYLISREVLVGRGKISAYDEFTAQPEEFENQAAFEAITGTGTEKEAGVEPISQAVQPVQEARESSKSEEALKEGKEEKTEDAEA